MNTREAIYLNLFEVVNCRSGQNIFGRVYILMFQVSFMSDGKERCRRLSKSGGLKCYVRDMTTPAAFSYLFQLGNIKMVRHSWIESALMMF